MHDLPRGVLLLPDDLAIALEKAAAAEHNDPNSLAQRWLRTILEGMGHCEPVQARRALRLVGRGDP